MEKRSDIYNNISAWRENRRSRRKVALGVWMVGFKTCHSFSVRLFSLQPLKGVWFFPLSLFLNVFSLMKPNPNWRRGAPALEPLGQGQEIVTGMSKYLTVVIISIFFLSLLWRWLWGSTSPLLQSQNNSFHCFILHYLAQNSFISLCVLLLSRIILLITSCKKRSFMLLYTQTAAVWLSLSILAF